jgi:hypothetical protein
VIFLGLGQLKPFPADIREKVAHRLANEYSPSGRTLFFRTLLDYAIRESDFSQFAGPMQDYVIALAVARAHMSNPSEPLTAEEFFPSVDNIDNEIVAMTLDAAFAGRWLGGKPDWNVMLQGLEKTTANQPIHNAVKLRVASFRKVFGLELSELDQILISTADGRMKFDAALILLAQLGSAPEFLLRASILVLLYLDNNPLRAAVGHHLSSVMSKIWLQVCDQQSALLFTPTISVPPLRTACGSELHGLQKSASIILAAAGAVGLRLDPKVTASLQRLAAKLTIV